MDFWLPPSRTRELGFRKTICLTYSTASGEPIRCVPERSEARVSDFPLRGGSSINIMERSQRKAKKVRDQFFGFRFLSSVHKNFRCRRAKSLAEDSQGVRADPNSEGPVQWAHVLRDPSL